MHRYVIEFQAKTIDETELRELLEQYFAVAQMSISRAAIPHTGLVPKVQTDVERLIISELSSGKPVRPKHLLALARGQLERRAMLAAIARLERSGVIRKPLRGVLVLSSADDPKESDIPPLNAAFAKPTQDRVLELLTLPRTAVELRIEINVSRQRIDQILDRLVAKRVVTRNEVTGERGQYVYLRSDVEDREVLLTRLPHLSDARARVLSALPAETICRMQDVADTVALTPTQLAIWFAQFSAQGLVTTFRLAQNRYVGITPRGYQHPRYDVSLQKTIAANLIEDFGPMRTHVLQPLHVLGDVKTIEITRALPENFFRDRKYHSGQIIQRLEASNLIQKTNAVPGKHARYRLTPKGGFAVAVLNRLKPPPPASMLHAEIERRHRAYVDRMRRIGFSNTNSLGVGSPPQLDAIRILKEHGALTQLQMHELMTIKYKNHRSLDLALRQMEKRGLARRVRESDGSMRKGLRGAQLWECSDAPNQSR